MRSLIALLAACAPMPLVAHAASPAAAPAAEAAKEPFVQATAEQAVRELATKLEENFVFPEKGKAYADMLRANLAAGKYASFADSKSFAEAVTADLQAVHKDGHLKVHIVPPEARSGPKSEGGGESTVKGGPPPALNAISKSGWLEDGVAYVRFEGFPGTDATIAALRAFIDSHKGAKTLIIDARAHRGGGLAEMDILFPQLFAEPTVLVAMDTRQSVFESEGEGGQDAALRRVAAPAGVVRQEHHVLPAAKPAFGNTRIFLLTAERTASAGEHLSLSLKRTKRATLVGETTRGAGHYGGMQPLDNGKTYAAFIPVGRTFDPDTGEGWEGTGVKPDVEVPADKALDEALKLAGVDKSAEVALAELK